MNLRHNSLFSKIIFSNESFSRDGTERERETVELVGAAPGGGGGGSGCGWRRSSSRVSNMRQANGRVGSYRTASEDYGPGKIKNFKRG